MLNRSISASVVNFDFFFPSDGSQEWLSVMDAELALLLLDLNSETRRRPAAPHVLEIGVWKGAWSSVVLANVSDARVHGVDPYPGSIGEVRRTMEQRLRDLGVDDRFVLTADLASLPPNQHFDLIHIDGEHSEVAVWSDLAFARDHLAPGGIIILDDWSATVFPGIASALFRFLEPNDFRIFLVSANKAYVTRRSDSSAYSDWLLEHASRLQFSRLLRHFGDGDAEAHAYRQASDVLGQPVLIAKKVARGEHLIPKRATETRLRRAIRALTPPLLVEFYRSLR